tara:strand:+ start:559 stop:834 length:276 start_codon:yes stop_codon:yes gene_type:complete
MKKLLIAPVLALFLFSCSDSDGCHECHAAYKATPDTPEVQIEIGEFCGSELEEVEAPGYLYSINDTIIGTDTIPAGSYEVHCEEHGDDHDH